MQPLSRSIETSNQAEAFEPVQKKQRIEVFPGKENEFPAPDTLSLEGGQIQMETSHITERSESLESALLRNEKNYMERFLAMEPNKQEETLQGDEYVKNRIMSLLFVRDFDVANDRSQPLIIRSLLSGSPSLKALALDMLPYYERRTSLDRSGTSLFVYSVQSGEHELAKAIYTGEDKLLTLFNVSVFDKTKSKHTTDFCRSIFPEGFPAALSYTLIEAVNEQKEPSDLPSIDLIRKIKCIILNTNFEEHRFSFKDCGLLLQARDHIFSAKEEEEGDLEFLQVLDQMGILFHLHQYSLSIECQALEKKPSVAPFLALKETNYPLEVLREITSKLRSVHSSFDLTKRTDIYREIIEDLIRLKRIINNDYSRSLVVLFRRYYQSCLFSTYDEKDILEAIEKGQPLPRVERIVSISLADRFLREKRIDLVFLLLGNLSEDHSPSDSIEQFFLSFYLDKSASFDHSEFHGADTLFTNMMIQRGLAAIMKLPASNPENIHIQGICEELLGLQPWHLISCLLESEEMDEQYISFMESRVRSLQVGKLQPFSVATKKHALCLVYEKTAPDKVDVTVYNTGDGLEFLEGSPISKVQTFCTFEDIRIDKINFSWFKTYLGDSDVDPKELYTFLSKVGRKRNFPSPHPEDLESPQSKGSCSVQCVMSFYRHFIMGKTEGSMREKLGAYKFFKLKMQKAILMQKVDVLDERIEKALDGVVDQLDLQETLFETAKKTRGYTECAAEVRDYLKVRKPLSYKTFEAYADLLELASILTEDMELEKNPKCPLKTTNPIYKLARNKYFRKFSL